MPQDTIEQQAQRLMAAGASDDDIVFFLRESQKAQPQTRQQKIDAIVERPYAGAKETFRKNPGGVGATVASLAAAPFTAGLSMPAMMLAQGALGAGGAAAAHGIKGAITGEMSSNVAGDATTQGLAGMAGPAVGGTLQTLGRGLYRAGVLPVQQVLGKYGDIIKTGVKNGVMATEGGLSKAGQLKEGRMATKEAALDEAGNRVSFDQASIADEAAKALRAKMAPLVRAGEITNKGTYAAQAPIDRFATQNPSGGMSPRQLEEVKRTLDDRLGGAYQNMRQKKPVSGREMSRMALSQTASRAQESAVPGYRAMNKDIMDAAGLESAIKRRVQGSGGNQGLENALTAVAATMSPAAIPARLAMLPPVLTGAGIAADRAGQAAAAPETSLLLRALLAQLSGGQ
jgi:hypothetical protein